MALNVFVRFQTEGEANVNAATKRVASNLQNVSSSLRQASTALTRAFTIPVAILGALATRLATLAPKSEEFAQATGRLRGQAVELGKSVQSLLVPVLNALARMLHIVGPLVKALADGFVSLSTGTQSVVVIVTLLLVTLGPLLKAFSALVAIFDFLTLRTTLITAGVLALVAVFALAARQTVALGQAAVSTFEGMYSWLVALILKGKLFLLQALKELQRIFPAPIEGVEFLGVQESDISGLQAQINALGNSAAESFGKAGAAFGAAFEGAKDDVMAIGGLIDGFVNIPLEKMASAAGVATKAGERLYNVLNKIPRLSFDFRDLGQSLGKNVSDALFDIATGATKAKEAIESLGRALLQTAYTKLIEPQIVGAAGGIFDRLFGAGDPNAKKKDGGGGLEQLTSIFDGFIGALEGLFGGKEGGEGGSFFTGLLSVFDTVYKGFSSVFETLIVPLVSLFIELGATIWVLIVEIGTLIVEVIANTVALIASAVAELVPFQAGGSRIVSRPTVFMAGEAGPERVQFSPLGGGTYGQESGVSVHIAPGAIIDFMSVNRFARRIGRAVATNQRRAVA